MGDMWDAVAWRNLEGKQGAKAGYVDGPLSAWPAEAWDTFKADPLVRITVLAARGADAYDGETGNAGPDAVAAALVGEVADGHHPWLYANQDQLGDYLHALHLKGTNPTDRSQWPRPGVYLWLADPSGNIASGSWRPPVDPVAVQDRQEGDVDHSTLYVSLDAPVPAPPAPNPIPAPPPQEVVTVQVPQLEQGLNGAAVAAAQKLLGGLTVDGVFGPLTHAAVVHFQAANNLAQDGIVGVHTWGQLLGHPQ
jgi:hypothetical protein